MGIFALLAAGLATLLVLNAPRTIAATEPLAIVVDTGPADVASPPAADPGPIARGNGTIAPALSWEWYRDYAATLAPDDPARVAIETELDAIRAQGAA